MSAWIKTVFVLGFAVAQAVHAELIVHYQGEDTSSPVVDRVGGQRAFASGGGHSYQFNGPSGYGRAVRLTSAGSWRLSGSDSAELRNLSNNFTVTAWVLLESNIANGKTGSNASTHRIMGDDDAWNGNGWGWGIRGNSIIFTKNGVLDAVDPSGVAVPNNQWVHLAVTVSSIDGINFFMDGMDLQGRNTNSANIIPSNTADRYAIGRTNGSGDVQWFPGRLDELRVYDSVLSVDEIEELAFPPVDPNLTASSFQAFQTVIGQSDVSALFSNSGSSQTLTISSEPTFTGQDAADFSILNYDASLTPGESGTVEVRLTPSRGAGIYTADLTLLSNDAREPSRTLTLSVNVTDPLDVILVDGYTDFLSYDPGDTMKVYLNTTTVIQNGKIDLFDMAGNKVLTHRADVGPQSVQNADAWRNGYGYTDSFEFTVPHLRSGVYRWEDNVHFMIRDPERDNRITVVYETNTKNSYSTAGGKSTYIDITNNSRSDKAVRVSFRRPQYDQRSWDLLPEFYWHARGLHRWLLDQRDLDIGYLCDYDLDNYEMFRNSDLLVLAGHSEYWTRQARLNFDRFLADGKNVINMSGNSQWGQVRYEAPDDSVMVLYKDNSDPITPDFLKTNFYNSGNLQFPQMDSIGVQWAQMSGSYPGVGWIAAKTSHWNTNFPNLPPEPTLANWPRTNCRFGGFKVKDASRPYFRGTGFQNGDVIHMISHEHDGILADFNSQDLPEFQSNYPAFHRKRIVAWEERFASTAETRNIGPILELQRTEDGGLLINTNSTDWGTENSFYHSPDAAGIRTLTRNMIDFLAPPEPTVRPSTGGRVEIAWTFGVLQSSIDGVNWTDHPGADSSPYLYTPGSDERQFRARFDFAD